MLSSSGPFTDMKLIPASLAMALAKSVLPQPGGPYNKTPLAIIPPISFSKTSVYLMGI